MHEDATVSWLVWCLIYTVVHVGVYLGVLRRRPAFEREMVVFLYHALSFVGLAAVTGAVLLLPDGPSDVAAALGGLAMHGIYSTSFLELWSLAQGGYSLQILDAVGRLGASGDGVDRTVLRGIGEAKRVGRLDGLGRLGLVRRSGREASLTHVGRLVAAFLALIVWLANVKERG